MPSDNKQNREENREPTFWEWLRYGKGTVSEPWPTPEELSEDETLQEQVKQIARLFNSNSEFKNKP